MVREEGFIVQFVSKVDSRLHGIASIAQAMINARDVFPVQLSDFKDCIDLKGITANVEVKNPLTRQVTVYPEGDPMSVVPLIQDCRDVLSITPYIPEAPADLQAPRE